MNILWIYDSVLNPESGGTERASELVMRGLRSRGHKCMGFLIFNQVQRGVISYEERTVSSLYEFLQKYDIDVVINQIAFNDWLLKDFYAFGGAQWRQEGGRVISVLHFDPFFPRKTLRLALMKWAELSFVRKIKRLGFCCLLPWYNYLSRKMQKEGYLYTYEYSDKYLLLSDAHKPRFLKITGQKDSGKLGSIFNPLTFEKISSPFELSKKENRVLVVSRLDESQKRLTFVFDTWRDLQKQGVTTGWRLIIVGTGTDELFYREYSHKLDLLGVEFKGRMNPEEEYRRASLFLMTSPAEGWGLTLTEALQKGVVPVIMDSSSVFREIVKEGETGVFVPYGNRKQFSEAVAELMQNSEKRSLLAKNALLDVKRFALTKAVDLWEQVLGDL